MVALAGAPPSGAGAARQPSMSLFTVYRRVLALLAAERPLFLLVCAGNFALAGLIFYESWLTRDRTTFVIAHRLSTIRDADLILVLENGQIVEQGRYEELVVRDGAFARLARAGEFVEMEAGSEQPGRAVSRAVAG